MVTQDEVYRIMLDVNRAMTCAEIVDRLNPTATVRTSALANVHDKLTSLQAWGLIGRDGKKWVVIDSDKIQVMHAKLVSAHQLLDEVDAECDAYFCMVHHDLAVGINVAMEDVNSLALSIEEILKKLKEDRP